MTLHEALIKLRDVGPTRDYLGICDNLRDASGGEFGLYDVRAYFHEWPEFSGHRNYPVPSGRMSPEHAYYAAIGRWDRNTPYGAARWRLLDFLIERTAP